MLSTNRFIILLLEATVTGILESDQQYCPACGCLPFCAATSRESSI